RLNTGTATIYAGRTTQLAATIYPWYATNQKVTWSSGNPSVAVVDENGLVTGISAGKAVITVTTADGSKTATCTVTVKAVVKVTGITLNKTSLSLRAGQSSTLTATVLPSNATDSNVTWSSGNTGVASVNSNGRITAKSKGTAVITVTTKDGSYTASCTVTVR
ncbi:MAG: Ig domain-containing protein, partial [Clostridiales bacterium]|nr:Ig domain-containing protein [Clostridiales bacterium]